MIATASFLRNELDSLMIVIGPDMIPTERDACLTRLMALPLVGVARAVRLRSFLFVLAGSWLYTPDRRTRPDGSHDVAESLGLTNDVGTWLSVAFIQRVVRDLRQRAEARLSGS